MPLILVLLFVLAPIAELAVIIQVGDLIGVLPTVVLLLLMSIIGAALLRREGTRAWRRFREALADMRLPTNEVIDGALVVLGGALMLTPGFLSDALGLLLIIPVSRAGIRRIVASRVRVMTVDAVGQRMRRPGFPPSGGRARHGATGADRRDPEVVDVEVVSIERNERPEAPRE